MPNSPKKNNLLKIKIEDILKRMKDGDDANKPVWITEIGWPSNRLIDSTSDRAVTPDQQAEYLVDTMNIILTYPQIEKVFWFCFRDLGTNGFDSEHNYGLIKYDFSLKPAYSAYKDFIAKWKSGKISNSRLK
jgi:exo-beta-1,3-glucanase (GH17 family)